MSMNTNTDQNQNYNKYKSTVVDSPVMNGENDLLNLNDYRRALIDFLKHAQTPITISLQGEWGCGKTSLMRSLEDDLCIKESSPFFSVWINTWQFSLLSDSFDASQVVINILQSIVKQIAEKDPEDKFRVQADNTVSLIMKGARFAYDIAGAALLKKMELEKEDIDNAIANFKSNDIEKLQSKPEVKIDGRISLVEQLKNQIDSLVNEVLNCAQNKGFKQGFIFFIDDLDRIKPTLAVEVLEVLKNILDFTYCISVIAIDYSVVVEGLKYKMAGKSDKDYRVYFDKLIQVQIAMPVFDYDIKPFLRKALSEISYFELDCTDERLEDLTQIAQRTIGKNPRNLKRLINNLSLANSFRRTNFTVANIEKDESSVEADDVVQNTIDVKMEIFVLACIQISYPKIYTLMINQPNFTVWGDDSLQFDNPTECFDEIKAVKFSYGIENYSSVDNWELYLFDLCNFNKNNNELIPHYGNLLYIFNKFKKILACDENCFVFNRIVAILSWLKLIDCSRY